MLFRELSKEKERVLKGDKTTLASSFFFLLSVCLSVDTKRALRIFSSFRKKNKDNEELHISFGTTNK